MAFEQRTSVVRCLIHHRASKFTASFDYVFVSEGIEIVRTPFRLPKTNAVAERWVRSAHQECLDLLIIVNERHLLSVLREYDDYYNVTQPHQGLGQQCSIGSFEPINRGAVSCRAVLGGLIKDYRREVA